MTESTIGKVVLVLGATSIFLLLSTGTGISGWSGFTTTLSTDPFANWNGWPAFENPSAVRNYTGGETLHLRNIGNGWDSCALADGVLLPVNGVLNSSQVLTPIDAEACWVRGYSDEHTDVTYKAGTWNISLFISITGTATWALQLGTWVFGPLFSYMNQVLCNFDEQSGIGSPITLTCSVAQFTGIVAIKISKNSGTGTVTLWYDASNSLIQSPGTGTKVCNWYDIGCVAFTAADWMGASLLYVGGLIWAALSGVFTFLTWFLTLVGQFFTGLISMLVYLVGGAGMPTPVSYVFQVIFVSLLAIVFLSMMRLIRGGSGA